jgi:hypothetical protein
MNIISSLGEKDLIIYFMIRGLMVNITQNELTEPPFVYGKAKNLGNQWLFGGSE